MPHAPFECDVTAAAKPGEVNELVVGLQDPPAPAGRRGILEAPTLTAAGQVYTSDVFAQPSVARRQLTLTATVENPGAAPTTIELRHTVLALDSDGVVTREALVKPDLAFPPQAVTVAAGGTAVVPLTQPWANPKLWWPDDPRRYAVETTLSVNGKPVDRVYTPLGFREWAARGDQLTLNGVPWHGRADLRHAGPRALPQAEAAVREWRRNGQTMAYYAGEGPWTGSSQADTLTVFDMAGVPVRRAPAGPPPADPAAGEDWRARLAARVKAERNHPSVFGWEVGGAAGPEVTKAAELVRRLDPTRPVLTGGDAPPPGPPRDYPDAAYAPPGDGPLVLQHAAFPPAAAAEFVGESAYLGRAAAAPGLTRFARMLSEGYRTRGVAAFTLALDAGPDAGHHKAWQPVAVFTREWDAAWPAGVTFPRTLTVLNDARDPSPLAAHWVLQTRHLPSGIELRGNRVLTVPPGGRATLPVTLDLPAVPPGEAVAADWAVVALRGGKEVFRDVKRVRLLGPVKPGDAPLPAVTFDPAGRLPLPVLNLVAGKPVASLADVPAGTRLLVVGPDAVTPELAVSPRWQALAAGGTRVVVFDQAHPLRYPAVPADLEPTAFAGRAAFPEDLAHPAFAGLTADDFLCWSGDHTVYRNCLPQGGPRGAVATPVRRRPRLHGAGRSPRRRGAAAAEPDAAGGEARRPGGAPARREPGALRGRLPAAGPAHRRRDRRGRPAAGAARERRREVHGGRRPRRLARSRRGSSDRRNPGQPGAARRGAGEAEGVPRGGPVARALGGDARGAGGLQRARRLRPRAAAVQAGAGDSGRDP